MSRPNRIPPHPNPAPRGPKGGPKGNPKGILSAYRLVLEYDGSRYQGWQKQGEKQTNQGVRTVAGTLERVLREAGLSVRTLGGSGRTDGGVHALGQVAHLHLASSALKPWDLQRIFDEGLPSDIAIREIKPCSPAFHARHDALERSYLYHLSLRRSALAKPYLWWIKGTLDPRILAEAWSAFQSGRDFTAFADLEPGEDSRVGIRACELEQDGSLILLRVTADHFLRRQVRRMVGAAVLCAQGRERVERIARDLEHPTEAANLFWGAKAAPSAGLFLESVRYPGDAEHLPPLKSAVRVD
ncbi:MAG TPA: tRNA pseudouridine synthase A [Holophaga sp.]|nr:tRNA pseudouridine synthase A [Holophaga sp.]